MQTHELTQGSAEWLAHRASIFNASEAPAMMGASKYQTRTELLHQKATGITPDVDRATQALFDRGHAAEAAARPLIEDLIGDDLAPQVGTVEIDGMTIGASFGCPFEGEVSEDRVVAMAARLAEAGPVEVAIADTIGVGNPAHVTRLVERVRQAINPLPVRVHFHNTRNTGLANVWAAVAAGATVVDGALGGLGGCPFAPGAAGNVPSEDVVYMLERGGIATGMDLAKMVEASHWLAGVMERKLPGMVAQAPVFPKVAD